MTTKNIANIQNNKLDFYINGTNRFDVTLRGQTAFTITENPNVPSGFQIKSALAAEDIQSSTTEFIGRISNINNHSIGNLKDVANITGIADNQILQWSEASSRFNPVDADTIGATSLLINAPTTAGQSGTNIDLALLTDRLAFSGTQNEIDVVYNESGKNLIISLPDVVNATSLIAEGTCSFGSSTFTGMVHTTDLLVSGTSQLVGNVIIDGDLTVNGTYTTINSEVKLIEDPIITLGYEEGGGASPYDIGFRGKYDTNSTHSALFFYDISATNFVLMNEYTLDDGTHAPADVTLTAGEYANLVAGGIILDKSTNRALADVSLYNLSYSTSFTTVLATTVAATNIIDCSKITNSTAVLSGILNITAWQDDLNSWAQNISNYSIIYKGSNDITVNFMTVFELNSNFEEFDLSTTMLTVRETHAGTFNVQARVLPLGHQIIA